MQTRIVRVILMMIFGMNAVSCSLFDSNEWKEARRERVKNGERYYEKSNGTFYCEDKYGNRTY
jgi:hypothetical protein